MSIVSRSRRRVPVLAAAFGAVVLSISLSGCTDLITYANQDRNKGIVAYNEGRYADAAGAFRGALKQDPRDYESHYFLGLCSLQMGSYQQAIVAFRSCLETRKVTLAGQEDGATAMKAYEGLAQAIVRSDDADQEVNRVEQAARNAKGAAAGQEYFVLAKIYRYRRLPDMALDFYNRACLADNKNFEFLKENGLYLEQLQQKQVAEQALRQAYAIDQKDSEVNAALARLGVVVGPSLKNKDDLVKPALPKGPLPDLSKSKPASAGSTIEQPRPAPATTGTPTRPAADTVQAPRD